MGRAGSLWTVGRLDRVLCVVVCLWTVDSIVVGDCGLYCMIYGLGGLPRPCAHGLCGVLDANLIYNHIYNTLRACTTRLPRIQPSRRSAPMSDRRRGGYSTNSYKA